MPTKFIIQHDDKYIQGVHIGIILGSKEIRPKTKSSWKLYHGLKFWITIEGVK